MSWQQQRGGVGSWRWATWLWITVNGVLGMLLLFAVAAADRELCATSGLTEACDAVREAGVAVFAGAVLLGGLAANAGLAVLWYLTEPRHGWDAPRR